MKIATVLFTHNRPCHTREVLEALSKSTVLPEKLIIYHDGCKGENCDEDWLRTEEIIRSVDWCPTTVYTFKKNKGLANSIIDGLNETFECFDAAIVLEDDCKPHPKFMSFMINALNKYDKNDRVFSVAGSELFLDIPKRNNRDVYFSQRISSYGWGTWKDRWACYERDYSLYKKMIKEPDVKERLHIWGEDLLAQLIGNITGVCDSWAVFWALKVIEKNGYCVIPYQSLIENIGFDDTGVHSGKMIIQKSTNRPFNDLVECNLPDDIVVDENVKRAYYYAFSSGHNSRYSYMQDMFISQIARLNLDSIRGEHIAIWGGGKICNFLIDKVKDVCSVDYIILSAVNQRLLFDVPVVSIDELPPEIKKVIVIPAYDIERIEWKVNAYRKDIQLIKFNELLMSE